MINIADKSLNINKITTVKIPETQTPLDEIHKDYFITDVTKQKMEVCKYLELDPEQVFYITELMTLQKTFDLIELSAFTKQQLKDLQTQAKQISSDELYTKHKDSAKFPTLDPSSKPIDDKDRTKAEDFMKQEMDKYEQTLLNEMKKRATLLPINEKYILQPFADTNQDALGQRSKIMQELVEKLKDVQNEQDLEPIQGWFKTENCKLLDTNKIDSWADKIKSDLELLTKKQASYEQINDYIVQAKAHLNMAKQMNINADIENMDR